MATRKQNERRFDPWFDLPNGGRRYWKDYPDDKGGLGRYVKIVDASEITLTVIQEVYDRSGELIAVHEKYPTDTGHRWLERRSKT
jgi:hypothetical protein